MQSKLTEETVNGERGVLHCSPCTFFRGVKVHKVEPQLHAFNRVYTKGTISRGNPASGFRLNYNRSIFLSCQASSSNATLSGSLSYVSEASPKIR